MPAPPVQSVSELTAQIKDCLEGNFPMVAVRGEISGCTRAGSGHVYLTLKDDDAQMRGVMWRTRASRLKFDLEDGLEVVAIGAVEVYPPRGSYQLVIEEMLPHGLGPLELAFRQLHDKLEAEGLFAPERKRPLPRIPGRIALVTSPTSAAVRDMLQVITRRWRGIDVVVVPVAVQGAGAAEQIAAAVGTLGDIAGVDVAIVGRGGGSLEDLWSFNEEVVARAIAACKVPIVSAVGHEIDVTIADLVSDRRALTPSEAGEIVVPDQAELTGALRQIEARLNMLLRGRAESCRTQLEAIAERRLFTRPAERLHLLAERLDELEARLLRSLRERYTGAAMHVSSLAATLDALSPLKVLSRGYSVTTRAESGELIADAEDAVVGEVIATRFVSGQILSRIEEKKVADA